MSKKTKRFKELSPTNTKLFKTPSLIDYDAYKPAFSFRDIRYGQKGCLSKCDRDNKSLIVDKLLKISQLTWKDIHSGRRQKYGYEHIPIKQFKVQLPLAVTPDMNNLLVFRFSDAGRMAGYKTQDIFHIVAIGPKHDLY